MRALILLPIFCALLSAQTPAGKAPVTPAPKAPAKSAAPNPRLMHPELAKAKAPDLYRVKFSTAKGDFVVEVHRDWAPLGADRFYNLVRTGYFVGDAFYRVISGVFAQFGIHPDPAVTRIWSTAPIKDDPRTQHNTPGTVVFANAGPNTRTTQLFINFQDNSSLLDGSNFAPIGTISEGFDIAKNLYSGYGEMKEMNGTGPSQADYTKDGKTYLDRSFPMLDKITAATVIFPEAPPPAAKKSAPATKAPAKK
jgi:peptidyl-prolyl cis-trans isomerase A (cyclophilin A)